MRNSVSSIGLDREQFIEKLKAAGITQEELQTARSEGPSAFQKLLADHGVQAPPPPPSPSSMGNSEKDEFAKKLEAAGITKEEFQAAFSQGPEAVRKLLESHGIEPPNGKGTRGSQGRNDFGQKLEAAGITKEEFETARAQGHESVKKLFESHGIQAPPAPPKD